MSKYIQYCNTLEDFFDLEYYSPRITHIEETEECIYNYIGNENYYEEIKYKIPLSFEILEDGTVGSTFDKVVEYMLNLDGNWKLFDSNVSVKEGDIISFRGNNNQYGDSSSTDNLYKFNTTCRFNIYGNIMSLINSSNFSDLNSIQSNYCFAFLFYNCNKLISVENLVLPATILKEGCYSYMFLNCTSLINSPILSATALKPTCYWGMFSGCTNLITAPELPATTLVDRCYAFMFDGCTSLTTMPKLRAIYLADGCYSYMFKDCISLVNIYYLPATTLAESCYKNMFMNCININSLNNNLSIIFFKSDGNNRIKTIQLLRKYTGYGLAEAKQIEKAGYISEDELLEGYKLTSLIEELINLNATILSDIGFFLPATTLVNACYISMFQGCTNLNYIKCLATDISASDCLSNWVSGVSPSGTFVKDPSMNSWPTGTSGIPSGWTVEDAA